MKFIEHELLENELKEGKFICTCGIKFLSIEKFTKHADSAHCQQILNAMNLNNSFVRERKDNADMEWS